MKFSLITPTHRPTYIKELFDSILKQTYKDWEWIIHLNGGITKEDIPQEIAEHSKVKITVDIPHEKSSNVGYQKNLAFNLGTGDILVEVDHDDLLTEDCLSELSKVFKKNPSVGFVYSDDVVLRDENRPYSSNNGWSYEEYFYEGKKYIKHNSFEPSAESVCTIYYAPDHVRSWRREVYAEAGGHDKNMSILDDLDLLIRTYLITEFKRIPKPLYLYRVHGDNTWLERNKAIQEGTRRMMINSIPRLAERDADLKGLLKLDLGGGLDPRPGYTSVDIRNGDIIADLTKKYPFEDNSVGVIWASHFIEHIADKQHTISEFHRILADGGWALIDVPSTDGRGAWQDPTHVSFWNQNSFYYYTRKEQARYIYNEDIKFQEWYLDTIFPGNWWRENNIPVTRAYLSAIKSNRRRPGLRKI